MTPEKREELKAAALAATPGPYILEQGDGELDSKARWPTDAKVLVFADNDCEHHPVADFSCNHSCRMKFEQEKNALFFSLADPSAILSLITQVEALTRKTVELERVYDERGLQIDRLETALQRTKVDALTVPQGWKLVPVEPTQDMNSAGYMRNLELGSAKRSADETYKAMVAAAPTIPAIPGTKEGA